MKAKITSISLCVMMLAASLLMSVSAAEPDQKVIDLGDGFYMVQTITQCSVTRAGNMVYGSSTGDVYYQSTQIGSATLFASFDISGSTAVAKTAVLQGAGMNGATYTDGGTYCGGNRATGTAIFYYKNIFRQLPLSLSCTPDGELY